MRKIPLKLLTLIAGTVIQAGASMAGSLTTLAGSEATYDSLPLTGVMSPAPLVMLSLSGGDQLHDKAYNDYSDLDGDGVPETTYKGNLGGGGNGGFVGYYGYFDAEKCYRYANGAFLPAAMAAFETDASDLPNAATGKVPYCNGQWSGNFLNWVSMTRMDAVRKLLYGGLRSTDGATQTILERDYLPTDAHAFAKYYNGADISRLTPFSRLENTAESSTSAGEIDAAAYTAIDIKSIRRIGTIATVTTSADHRFITGEAVLINSNCNKIYNHIKTRVTRLSENRFSYILGTLGTVGELPRDCPSATGTVQLVLPITASASAPLALGDQLSIVRDADDYMNVVITSLLDASGSSITGTASDTAYVQMSNERNGASPVVRTVGSGASTRLIVTNLSATGISFCNLTPGSTASPSVNLLSQTNTNAPILRVARGNYLLWSANTGFQCHWLEETSDQQGELAHGLRSNGNRAPLSGIDASAENPVRVVSALGTGSSAGEYAMRVQVCTAGLQGSERCEAYPTRSPAYPAGIQKPIGLLQIYGESGNIDFGLVTPGDQDNIFGGVLRKTTGPFADEIKADTDGSFNGTANGVIAGISKLRIYGYNYADGRYDAGSKDAAPVAPTANSWTTPLASNANSNDCASLNVLRLNAGTSSYNDSSAVFFAHTNRIISSLSGVTSPTDTPLPKVANYGIQLAGDQPRISIRNPTDPSKILATLRPMSPFDTGNATPDGGDTSEDFHVVSQDIAAGTGRFYISWQDRGQGGDPDQSVAGTISYQVNGDKTISVTTDTLADSDIRGPGFGYIISGTTQDGPHFNSGTFAFTYTSSSLGSWGSPDSIGNTSNGGLPENYFLVAKLAALESSFGDVLNAIATRSASGAAASVVANSRQGEGAVYQALYIPSRSDSQNRRVKWIGDLQALFVDKAGNLREDGNGDRQLEESDFAADPAIRIAFVDADRKTEVIRYHGDPATTAGDKPAPLETLKPLWNARTILSKLSDPENQRSYNTALVEDKDGNYSGGRYIITFRDHGLGGKPDNGAPDQGNDVVAFTTANFGAGEYGVLNVGNAVDASALVDYIRGKEDSRLRNRTLDFDGKGRTEVMRLGDIVNSTPITVAAPAEAFNLLYDDQSYDTFFKQYRKRRNVVYAGANDGMIHAFNAGFYDPTTLSFHLTGEHSETSHPLGAELWAYVPFNLLPHLTWLSDPAYGHVWYADGSPRVFDARIFPADKEHPDGWGTVLVVGMRLGGGAISLPVNAGTRAGFTHYAAGLGSGASVTTRSAYAILDVTDPELPPKVLAELTDPSGKLGFTTSYPTVAAFRPRDGSTPEKWYLVFGSGPTNPNVRTALNNAESSQDAQLFIYDLATGQYAAGYGPYDLGAAAAANSFVGNPVAVDWDLNGKADALYFGTGGGTANTPSGQLFRLDFHRQTGSETGGRDTVGNESSGASDWTAPTPLLNAGGPVLATPSVAEDRTGRKWVLSGTGRFLTAADKTSNPLQVLFGVIDSLPDRSKSPPSLASLVDTTLAEVSPGADTAKVSGVPDVSNESGLESRVTGSGGWRLNLGIAPTASERSIAGTSVLAQILFATAYTPAATACGGDGNTRLFALNFQTGAALPRPAALGATTQIDADGATSLATTGVVDLGPGLGTAPTIHIDGSGAITVNVQTSNGAITQTRAKTSGTERSGEIDWRETHPNSGP